MLILVVFDAGYIKSTFPPNRHAIDAKAFFNFLIIALTILVKYSIINEKEAEVRKCDTLITLNSSIKNGTMKL